MVFVYLGHIQQYEYIVITYMGKYVLANGLFQTLDFEKCDDFKAFADISSVYFNGVAIKC